MVAIASRLEAIATALCIRNVFPWQNQTLALQYDCFPNGPQSGSIKPSKNFEQHFDLHVLRLSNWSMNASSILVAHYTVIFDSPRHQRSRAAECTSGPMHPEKANKKLLSKKKSEFSFDLQFLGTAMPCQQFVAISVGCPDTNIRNPTMLNEELRIASNF